MHRHGIIVKPTGNLGATFNPAATAVNDQFALLVRSVPKGYTKLGKINEFDNKYTSHLSLWTGKSPDKFTLTNPKALVPDQPYDKFGVEDPRVTKIKDTYYICYTSIRYGLGEPNASDGVRIALASTKDFKSFKKHGVIGPDRHCKAGTLFESGGRLHFMWKDEENIERTMMSPAPDDFENKSAWQKLWAQRDIEQDVLVAPQNNGYEDFGIEPGAPPIDIGEGLLTVYSSISSDYKWSISLMLLDKNDPTKILAKTNAPLIKPEASYELSGDVNNVVFPCGALVQKDRLYIYYGGADSICAVASEDMKTVRASLRPFKNNPAPNAKP